jgi:hypothetical protein
MATSFSGGRSREYPVGTTNHGQATGKLLSLAAASQVHPFCNLQRPNLIYVYVFVVSILLLTTIFLLTFACYLIFSFIREGLGGLMS